MFGIGLPEMIVILAVALIVVGPDKLPDMARSVAKWVFELKKTVNQVKESLADEDNIIGSVHTDLRRTGNDLKTKLLDSDDFTWHEPGGPGNVPEEEQGDIIDVEDVQAGMSAPEAPPESGRTDIHPDDADPAAESEDKELPPEQTP